MRIRAEKLWLLWRRIVLWVECLEHRRFLRVQDNWPVIRVLGWLRLLPCPVVGLRRCRVSWQAMRVWLRLLRLPWRRCRQ